MSLEQQINTAIKTAMRAKDKVTLRALRAVKTEILKAKTEKGAAEEMSDAQEIKILSKMVKQRKDAAGIFDKQGREDLAAKEKEEIAVIQQFLPAQLSEEDLKAGIQGIIEETGAASMKDMGKVMGIASKKFAGQADGKQISGIVRALLQ